MGLRFRKSVTICKGVRLNFGKTGVSISAGVPGFRKTIHSSGRVTTSIGLPGTGIYYVDTKNISQRKTEKKNENKYADLFGGNKHKQAPVLNGLPHNSKDDTSYLKENGMPTIGDDTTIELPNMTFPTNVSSEKMEKDPSSGNGYPDIIVPVSCEPTSGLSVNPISEKSTNEITYDIIKTIFENCDVAIEWVDVISHKAPTSDEFILETWNYLHNKAVSVFDGNIDTYLEIIRTVNPYDDLLDYADNFEFGTEDPSMMEIEFSIIDNEAIRMNDGVYEDYCAAIIIRAARDTFALLPVDKVKVNAAIDGRTSTYAFMRETFNKVDFIGKDASDILKLITI